MQNLYFENGSFYCKACERRITFTPAQFSRKVVLTCTCGQKIHLNLFQREISEGIKNLKDMVNKKMLLKLRKSKNNNS